MPKQTMTHRQTLQKLIGFLTDAEVKRLVKVLSEHLLQTLPPLPPPPATPGFWGRLSNLN